MLMYILISYLLTYKNSDEIESKVDIFVTNEEEEKSIFDNKYGFKNILRVNQRETSLYHPDIFEGIMFSNYMNQDKDKNLIQFIYNLNNQNNCSANIELKISTKFDLDLFKKAEVFKNGLRIIGKNYEMFLYLISNPLVTNINNMWFEDIIVPIPNNEMYIFNEKNKTISFSWEDTISSNSSKMYNFILSSKEFSQNNSDECKKVYFKINDVNFNINDVFNITGSMTTHDNEICLSSISVYIDKKEYGTFKIFSNTTFSLPININSLFDGINELELFSQNKKIFSQKINKGNSNNLKIGKKFFKSFIVFISVCCIFGFLFFILWLILRKNKDEILLNN